MKVRGGSDLEMVCFRKRSDIASQASGPRGPRCSRDYQGTRERDDLRAVSWERCKAGQAKM